jgi:hypothetical protein
MGHMTFIQKYRYYVIAAAVVVVALLAWGGYYLAHHKHILAPLPETTEFRSGNFSFTYPRIVSAKEYDDGVVSVGGNYNGVFIPLVDVVRYKSDPQSAAPANLTAFVTKQAQALCGGDTAGERISCGSPVVTEYTSPSGLQGQEISLTLTKANTTTGTSTSTTFAPIYVFDPHIIPASVDGPARYDAIFVYPTFSSFLATGTSSPELIGEIVTNLKTTD